MATKEQGPQAELTGLKAVPELLPMQVDTEELGALAGQRARQSVMVPLASRLLVSGSKALTPCVPSSVREGI